MILSKFLLGDPTCTNLLSLYTHFHTSWVFAVVGHRLKMPTINLSKLLLAERRACENAQITKEHHETLSKIRIREVMNWTTAPVRCRSS